MERLHQNVTIEQLQGMMADLIVSQRETKQLFQETDKKFQATDKKFQATDKKFQATDKRFKETDKRFKETDKQFKETDQKFKEVFGELGGIGKSNGEIAESFFSTALAQNMQVGKLKFDYIDFNTRRKRNNTEAEYDVILYNHYKVLIIEVKYNFRLDHVRDFYTLRLKKFRTLFSEYKDYKIYGGVAALSYEKDVIEEAQKYGFYVLTQNNDKLKIENKQDFIPNEIK